MKSTAQAIKLLTVSEVAKKLRVDDVTVRRWAKQGAMEAIALPFTQKNQAYRFKQETLDTLLAGGDVSVKRK